MSKEDFAKWWNDIGVNTLNAHLYNSGPNDIIKKIAEEAFNAGFDMAKGEEQ